MCFEGVMDWCVCCGISIVWLRWYCSEHEVFPVLGVVCSRGVCCPRTRGVVAVFVIIWFRVVLLRRGWFLCAM